MHSCTHTHTRAHTHTRTHAHAHAHTDLPDKSNFKKPGVSKLKIMVGHRPQTRVDILDSLMLHPSNSFEIISDMAVWDPEKG